MTLEEALLARVCACLALAALATATRPAHVHEARQGPVSSIIPSGGPGPVSPQSSSETTMSPTTTSDHSSSTSASSSTHSASEASSATPQPSSSPAVLSIVAHNMTTCTSSLISWNYTGPSAQLLLSISSVAQNNVPYRFGKRANSFTTLGYTNTAASNWTWTSVNVTQGWYQIEGLVISTSFASGPFYVANGTDVACLTSTSLQASSTPSPTPTSSSSHTNVAAIVGGVIGAVVGVALAVIAGICLWSRSRKKPVIGRRLSKRRKWGPLRSANSSLQRGEVESLPADSHFHHGHSESTAGVLQNVPGGKLSATPTPGDSDEDAAVVGEEKAVSPLSYSGMSPFDALNTPVHRHNSMYDPTPPGSECSRSRSTSLHTSAQSIEQQAQRIRSSMETSIRRRSERLSMPTLPSPALTRFPQSPLNATQLKEEYALSPVSATPANRSISTGAVSIGARRASRKPVPQYDPSMLLEDSNADTVSTFTAGAESSQSHGTGTGPGAFGTPTDLVHKASFGDGRPVHYLIPDMPPPPRD